jgi:serine/threonine protein kinase
LVQFQLYIAPFEHRFAHWLLNVQGNVLIDDTGKPVITDFGLSKVIEEVNMESDSPRNIHGNMVTSFFAGSTRWMAPELVMALVQDDGIPPVITTYSDVYAFASICLEVSLRLSHPTIHFALLLTDPTSCL